MDAASRCKKRIANITVNISAKVVTVAYSNRFLAKNVAFRRACQSTVAECARNVNVPVLASGAASPANQSEKLRSMVRFVIAVTHTLLSRNFAEDAARFREGCRVYLV